MTPEKISSEDLLSLKNALLAVDNAELRMNIAIGNKDHLINMLTAKYNLTPLEDHIQNNDGVIVRKVA